MGNSASIPSPSGTLTPSFRETYTPSECGIKPNRIFSDRLATLQLSTLQDRLNKEYDPGSRGEEDTETDRKTTYCDEECDSEGTAPPGLSGAIDVLDDGETSPTVDCASDGTVDPMQRHDLFLMDSHVPGSCSLEPTPGSSGETLPAGENLAASLQGHALIVGLRDNEDAFRCIDDPVSLKVQLAITLLSAAWAPETVLPVASPFNWPVASPTAFTPRTARVHYTGSAVSPSILRSMSVGALRNAQSPTRGMPTGVRCSQSPPRTAPSSRLAQSPRRTPLNGLQCAQSPIGRDARARSDLCAAASLHCLHPSPCSGFRNIGTTMLAVTASPVASARCGAHVSPPPRCAPMKSKSCANIAQTCGLPGGNISDLSNSARRLR